MKCYNEIVQQMKAKKGISKKEQETRVWICQAPAGLYVFDFGHGKSFIRDSGYRIVKCKFILYSIRNAQLWRLYQLDHYQGRQSYLFAFVKSCFRRNSKLEKLLQKYLTSADV